MAEFQKKYVQTSEGTICYFAHIVGPERPTIMLLHGLSSNHTNWLMLMDLLAQQNLNVIAPDLRGHGYSDKRKKRSVYKIAFFTRDIEILLDAESIGAVHLVGYSYGGYVGIDFAIKNPLRTKSLSLISANHVSPLTYGPYAFLSKPIQSLINAAGWLLLWESRKNYQYFDNKKTTGYWYSTFQGYLTMPLSINFWMLSEVGNLNYKDSISNIACPVLIIYGKGDTFITEREIKDMETRIPDCTVICLDQSGHYLAARHEKEIADEVIKFQQKLL